MKKLIIGIIGLIIVAFVIRGVLENIASAKKKVLSIPEIQKRDGIPVVVEKAKVINLNETRVYSGTIEGKEQADGKAKMMERLETIGVKIGDRLSKGEIVATLSRDNPNARYQQSWLQWKNAEREHKRMKTLFEEGAVSERDLEQTELALDIALNDFAAVEELLNIRSPINGIVTHIFYQVGETVGPGESVVRVAQLDEVELKIGVGESEIHSIRKGQNAKVSINQSNIKEFIGDIDRVSLSADPDDRTFDVRLRIPNPDYRLRPGMFATAEIIIQEHKDVVTIFKDAIVQGIEEKYVFVINNDNIAEKRVITTGITSGILTEIVSGLKEGELVVVEGMNKLQGDEKVKIAE